VARLNYTRLDIGLFLRLKKVVYPRSCSKKSLDLTLFVDHNFGVAVYVIADDYLTTEEFSKCKITYNNYPFTVTKMEYTSGNTSLYEEELRHKLDSMWYEQLLRLLFGCKSKQQVKRNIGISVIRNFFACFVKVIQSF
jgi:hypothetical protein